MTDSLLAALSVRFSDQAENIATEGLCYILQKSAVARRTLIDFVSHYACDLPVDLVFSTQVQNQAGGISDLVGKDGERRPRLIVESKFWAGLTDAQPVTYLHSLPTAQPSVLLVLAPALRLATLWPELQRRLAAGSVQTTLVRDGAAPCYVARVGDQTFLALISWRALLGVLHSALIAADNLRLAGDVVQLQGLSDRMDTTTFLPLRSEDLAPLHGRRTLDYCALVDEVAARLKVLPGFRFRGYRATGASGSYGRYLRIHEFAAFLRYDAQKWAALADTPLWLDVKGKNWEVNSPEAKKRLEILSHEQPPRLMTTSDGGLTVPLFPPTRQERQQVVDDLLEQVLNVAALLAPVASPQ